MHTTDIYLAVFRSLHRASRVGCGGSEDGLDTASWPYDGGDDPSFYCARTVGANLTWGVCRQQVRNRISPGDVVVFFSVRGNREDRAPFRYRLCAVATVERKVSQTDIWTRAELKPFRSYRNLLIRRLKGGLWEHHEPILGVNHKDWFWRIADQGGFCKKDFRRLESSDVLTADARIRGRSISIAENYVIFSARPHQTIILDQPPLVARCDSNGRPEKWRDDPVSRTTPAHTLDVAREYGSRRRSLRSINTQHSHPVIRWSMPVEKAAEWHRQLLETLDPSLPAIFL